ncbi:alpha/beta hydrolase [Novosphingobium sp.]|uniref:alpha/beta hydrolase n=1 Tax=Novosphingobium sp. TaxID=1874826 RepID=UPI0038BB5600
MAIFDFDMADMAWAEWAFAAPLLVGGMGYAAFARALSRNPVALLNAADRIMRGGNRTVRLVESARFGANPAQKLQVLVPARRPAGALNNPLPVVVFIHGGAWMSGDPHDYRFIARTLADHGFAVVLAGYRLLPQGRYPAMLEDGAGALRWVVDNAARHGLDPGRIAVMGHSAGGYNALMLALDPRWLGAVGLEPAALRAVIALSAPTDFLPLDDPASTATFGHIADLAATQPVNHAHADAPPLLLVHGANDRRVRPRNTRALAAALDRVGAPHRAVVLEGMNHEAPLKVLARPFARDGRVLAEVLDFLGRVQPFVGPATAASPTVHPNPC